MGCDHSLPTVGTAVMLTQSHILHLYNLELWPLSLENPNTLRSKLHPHPLTCQDWNTNMPDNAVQRLLSSQKQSVQVSNPLHKLRPLCFYAIWKNGHKTGEPCNQGL